MNCRRFVYTEFPKKHGIRDIEGDRHFGGLSKEREGGVGYIYSPYSLSHRGVLILRPKLQSKGGCFVEHSVGDFPLYVEVTVAGFGTLLESVPTHLAGLFVITSDGKIEENLSTTGANLAGVLDKNGGKIGGVVEQNCEAGAVEHRSRVAGGG